MRRMATVLIMALLAAGCQNGASDRPQSAQNTQPTPAQVTHTVRPLTPTATPSPPATPTASKTPAPTSTATPTATAVPVLIMGDPRAAAQQRAGINRDVVCGLVDFFDFPLEPPDARDNVRGGGDFGRYRGRYEKFHAGEDWWINGRQSLGAPVYSVGHGRVTYAEPTGWGRDQGVIIVRHTFADGRELLSFYGHLDPESFEVKAGDCVARGQMIGQIGKPRSSPHLHFEMRTHMPLETGTGYWPEDPRAAGWLPPSETIWDSRLAVSPGVLWTKPFTANGIASLGAMDGDLFVVLDGTELAGFDTAGGDERWRLAMDEDVERVLLDSKAHLIYAANQFGEVKALSLQVNAEGVELRPNWTVDLDMIGIPELLPLPGGGVVITSWDAYAAISDSGDLLWEAEMEERPFDWLINGDRLMVSSISDSGSLWSADAGGWERWNGPAGGHLADAGDQVWLYDGQSIYLLEPESRTVEAMMTLPTGYVQMGDMMGLADGGAVVVHTDRYDRRLIELDREGNLQWERSIAGLGDGQVQLFADHEGRFLLFERDVSSGSEVSLLSPAHDGEVLTHLFNGGTRNEPVDQTRLYALGNGRVLIHIDGRRLVVVDTQEANHLVSSDIKSSQ